mgnify:CR=1 FL=1|jgi:hypothetical protein
MIKVSISKNQNIGAKQFIDLINEGQDVILLPDLNYQVRDPCLLIEQGHLFVLFGKTFEALKEYQELQMKHLNSYC